MNSGPVDGRTSVIAIGKDDVIVRGDKASNELPEGLAAPARRALAAAGYTSLDQLAKAGEAEVLALHGMGPNAIAKLRSALRASGRSFARR
jgi:predicted Fe-Mo cluster-binding NifX family protein